jgi:spectinomycin phosphotransferase
VNVAGEVRRAYGIDLVAVEPVTSGTAAEVWRATAADGAAYAVKNGPAPAAQSHLAGVPGVPHPLRPSVPTALSLTPWIDGRGAGEGMTRHQWQAFGVLLARVHAVPPLASLPRETHTHDAQAALMRRVDEAAREPARDPLVAALAEVWDAERSAALGARADMLARDVTEAPYVLCHGDPHAGNVLVSGDDVWLVDWDDALLAPPERDLMLVLSGVADWAPLGDGDEEAFLTGYGAGYGAVPDATRLAYYLCVRAMEDAGGFAADVLDGTRDAETALRIVRGLLSPGGVVTRALA